MRVEFTDRISGEPGAVIAGYVLGCDGANSLARRAIGPAGATMEDLQFEQRWLVVDVTTGAVLGQWAGVHQVCDPARAATYMQVSATHHRFEFQLLPDETADDYRSIDGLQPLIAPWTGTTQPDDLELMRVTEYTFRAQVADRWRDRRVFLLGDAAHLTPPFIGQGMGAGLRDAMNLAWKLAGVLGGDLPETVLDSYEAERKPHVRTLIARAKLVGRAMTAGGDAGSLARRLVAPWLPRLSALGLPVVDFSTETPAVGPSDLAPQSRLRRSLVGRTRLGRTLVGRQCPNAALGDGRPFDAAAAGRQSNAPLGDGRRFDAVAAGRFAVVTATEPAAALSAQVEQRGGVVVVALAGSELGRWLRAGRSTAALVRPDGTVMAAGADPARLCDAVPPFSVAVHRRPAAPTPAPV